MANDRTKVYIYTRVSTTMQIDGFSLEAQKTRMKAFCDYNDFEIVGEYEDAGKSGKSIEGRLAFTKMIDSSKDAGKLMISVLSAVAEIERENIRVQTMEGRAQKAREGKWNGGFAPYGYKLVDSKLIVNEEEAEAIRLI